MMQVPLHQGQGVVRGGAVVRRPRPSPSRSYLSVAEGRHQRKRATRCCTGTPACLSKSLRLPTQPAAWLRAQKHSRRGTGSCERACGLYRRCTPTEAVSEKDLVWFRKSPALEFFYVGWRRSQQP